MNRIHNALARRVRILAGILAAAACVAIVSGCGGCSRDDDRFPPTLAFPPCADRLVLKLPDKPAAKLDAVDERDKDIAALDSLGGRTADPTSVAAERHAELDHFLKETFGTPAEPREIPPALKLGQAHLKEGSRLFRRHCLQCHNLVGDGRGPSGETIPFPRDYRQGAFKFVSSGEGMKPRRADLLHTLHDGLTGTAMPSFSLLQEGERDLLAGYVMFLAMRGQVEFESLRALSQGEPNDPPARFKAILGEWEKAQTAPPVPAAPDDGEPDSPKYQDAVRRGFRLFLAKTDNSCISCHGDFGRKPVLRYDVWGTVAKPANLTERDFKGGKRPEDVYARIRFGIAPVGMPGHAPPKYSERDVWDLVRFVTSAPYRVRLPPDVRAAVYPDP